MRSILQTLLFLFIFIATNSFAQITIVESDMPAYGDEITTATDTSYAGINIGNPGANQSWDLSNLENFGENIVNVMDPDDTPFGVDYPTSNIAFVADGTYSYGELNSDHLIFISLVTADIDNNGEFFDLNPTQTIFQFPVAYGNTYTDESGLQFTIDGVDFMVDSIRFEQHVTREVEIDGWGTVVTPEGTYNCLRRKTQVVTADSLYALFFGVWTNINGIETTEETYEWLAKDASGIVAQVTLDVNGVITDADYNLDIPTGGLAPIANFSYTDLGAGAFDFMDESFNTPTSWLWDFGDTNTSDEQFPSHVYDTPGIYEVCLTAINDGGSDMTCQTIEVVFAPIAGYIYTDNGNGDFDFIDISSNNPDTYLWDFGDGETSEEQNPNHVYSEPGDYIVCLTVTNDEGSDMICETVTVVFAPIASYTYTDNGEGDVDFMDNSTNNPDTYLWDFGDTQTSTDQNPNHVYAAPGDYIVCLTVTNAAGSDTVCETVTIVFAPVADFSFTNDDVGNYDFMDLSLNGPESWDWDFGGAGTSDQPNPAFPFTVSDTYNVCLTVTNSAGSDMTCQEIMVVISSTFELEDVVELSIFPNPTFDHLNIEFSSEIKTPFSIEFFNALGQKVFNSTLELNQVIDVKEWGTGLYYYQILTDNEIVTSGKISVQ